MPSRNTTTANAWLRCLCVVRHAQASWSSFIDLVGTSPSPQVQSFCAKALSEKVHREWALLPEDHRSSIVAAVWSRFTSRAWQLFPPAASSLASCVCACAVLTPAGCVTLCKDVLGLVAAGMQTVCGEGAWRHPHVRAAVWLCVFTLCGCRCGPSAAVEWYCVVPPVSLSESSLVV